MTEVPLYPFIIVDKTTGYTLCKGMGTQRLQDDPMLIRISYLQLLHFRIAENLSVRVNVKINFIGSMSCLFGIICDIFESNMY